MLVASATYTMCNTPGFSVFLFSSQKEYRTAPRPQEMIMLSSTRISTMLYVAVCARLHIISHRNHFSWASGCILSGPFDITEGVGIHNGAPMLRKRPIYAQAARFLTFGRAGGARAATSIYVHARRYT
jgi:hypothetical protein